MFGQRCQILAERDLVTCLFFGELYLRALQFGQQLGADVTIALAGMTFAFSV